MLSKKQYNIIQFHAAITLFGYWFVQAICQLALGSAPQTVSIAYDGFQLLLSLYVIKICPSGLLGEEKSTFFFKSFSIIMFLYSFRIIWDIMLGPFLGIVSQREMWMNFLMTVLHTFTGVWALIASRKYLNNNTIINWIFHLCLATTLFIIISMQIRGEADVYKEDRIDGMGGLHSLSMAKIGMIGVIASIHRLINNGIQVLRIRRINIIMCVFSIILSTWLLLASGARGSVVGVVVSLAVYWLLSSRKNIVLAMSAIVSVVLFIINIVPILEWLFNYFPVVSNRMLLSILENDQSNRDILRERAYELIIDNPIIGYSYRLNADSTGYTTHNGILDIALALGIPVCIWFVYVCYIKSCSIIISLSKNKCYFFSTCLLVSNLVSAMSGSAIDNNCFGFSIIFAGSMYYCQSKSK